MRNESLPAINELNFKKIQNGFQKLGITFDNDFSKLVNELVGKYLSFYLIFLQIIN